MAAAASDFQVSLVAEPPLVAGPGSTAECLVTSASHLFTPEVQNLLQFAVKRRTSLGYERVNNPRELCSLSEDLRRFRFGFELAEEGPYRIVVRLGGADVAGSPLKAKVSAAVEGLEGAGTVAEKVAQESNNTRNKVDCLSSKMNSIEISPKARMSGGRQIRHFRHLLLNSRHFGIFGGDSAFSAFFL